MKFKIHADAWEGNADHGTSAILESDSIRKYLTLLDGKVHTQILIIPQDRSSSILIGGGNNETYVLTFTVGSDEDFYNLVDLTKKGEQEIELVTGGQAGLFSDKYCADFNTILAAADYYVQHGERNPNLHWEKQA
ncbi:Imm1 family immunity protein [Chryseolinea lacunae]|uniref:Uncharacterized protein n=1 Tax=Chryseolinea lacunae TaxID=2801331 RepID=A0ABS1KXL2_9BACT|nr:Imm1 family immunity protein [Chryseolinea lacunae]MBL0744213.1 hypothetical protein [Chryseolinea lacunae]